MKSYGPSFLIFTALFQRIDRRWNRQAQRVMRAKTIAVICILSTSRALASTNSLPGKWLNGAAAPTNSSEVPAYAFATDHGALLVGGGHYVLTNDVPPKRWNTSEVAKYPVSPFCAIPLYVLEQIITVPFGQTVQLISLVGGSGLGYGWTSNGVPVPNANTPSLTISNVTANAVYDFIITNECGDIYSPEVFVVNVITPSPTIFRYSNSLVLMWTNGTLQQATNPLGPWTSAGMTSPYTNDMSTNAQMFFRLSYP
jgi:hypothetical protein